MCLILGSLYALGMASLIISSSYSQNPSVVQLSTLTNPKKVVFIEGCGAVASSKGGQLVFNVIKHLKRFQSVVMSCGPSVKVSTIGLSE